MSENDERPYFSAADFLAALLVHRGIDEDDYCPECGATGTKTYGSSATWSGGVGGQMMTNSVCDKCWGSGSKSRPWASWRQREDLSRKIAEQDKKISGLLAQHVAKDNFADALSKSIREYMDICEDLSRKLEEARKRIGELERTGKYGETKSEQAYQVIGSLATIANRFEHPEVIRALDYFSSDEFDPEFLPFAIFEGKPDA